MHKKIFILLFIFACINPLYATEQIVQKNSSSHDKRTISTQEYAQQQLNHLTVDAPFWTGPTKGLAYAFIGAVIIISTTMFNETINKLVVGMTGSILMAAGLTFSGLSAFDDDVQRRKYQLQINHLQKDNSLLFFNTITCKK